MTLKEKVKESETAVAFDKECLENDKREQMKKASYLTQFRDGNKQVCHLSLMPNTNYSFVLNCRGGWN